jgi:primosomal protein N'
MCHRTETHFKVGDRVRFQLGAHRVVGTVVEDRGFIGVDGRQLVRVEVALDPTYMRDFELPATLLSAA